MKPLILVVDDEPAFLNSVQKELEAREYQVATAVNGMVALRLVQKQRPALILLDVAMPMTNGFETFKRLRALPDTAQIPVIFLTGVPSADVYPTVEHAANVAHLKKPVDLPDLISLIHQLLNKSS